MATEPAAGARCRTCGVPVKAGQIRCKTHLVAFRRWLRGLDGAAFIPTRDGLRGEDEQFFDSLVEAVAEREHTRGLP